MGADEEGDEAGHYDTGNALIINCKVVCRRLGVHAVMRNFIHFQYSPDAHRCLAGWQGGRGGTAGTEGKYTCSYAGVNHKMTMDKEFAGLKAELERCKAQDKNIVFLTQLEAMAPSASVSPEANVVLQVCDPKVSSSLIASCFCFLFRLGLARPIHTLQR